MNTKTIVDITKGITYIIIPCPNIKLRNRILNPVGKRVFLT